MRVLQSRQNPNIRIDTYHLLGVCEYLTRKILTSRPEGDGTAQNPYAPTTPKQWAWCWQKENAKGHKYYRILGRIIEKKPTHYVSDVTAKYQPTSNINLNQSLTSDPKYRQIAEMIDNPATIIQDVGEIGPINYATVFNGRDITGAMLDILIGMRSEFGQPSPASNEGRLFDSFLPVVMAAMFIAEPARNPRAWPINLMILDLMQQERWTYSWSEILWHPDDRTDLPDTLAQPVQAPIGGGRTMIGTSNKSDLHLIGGLMPSSPTQGGIIGKRQLINHSMPNAPGGAEKLSFGSIAFDYIHEKEIGVLVPWLQSVPMLAMQWSVVPNGSPESHPCQNKSKIVSVMPENSIRDLHMEIKRLILDG
ncbi:hypothetical protein FHS96_000118 [Sphingomonas zeicaulis]|uniref:hypothetical protein n=1 Tax=Sphingomonas zeicaulis TaxID=1632740 RepID=UPI003D1D72D8